MAAHQRSHALVTLVALMGCTAALSRTASAQSPHYDTVFIVGQDVPGSDDLKFGGLGGFLRNNTGAFAFSAGVYGPGVTGETNTALFAGPANDLSIIAREGSAAPGTAAGQVYGDLRYIALNDAGAIAYATEIRDINGYQPMALYSTSIHDLSLPQLVAREGDPSPDAAGWVYASFHDVTLNESGALGYRAILRDTPGTTGPSALYVADNGGTGTHHLVAKGGNAAPDAPAGVVYDLPHEMTLTDSGEVAFQTFLAGPGITSANNTAFCTGPIDNPRMLIRSGMQAPGVEAGAVFQSLQDRPSPRINNAGIVAFQALLTGPGISGDNNGVLYVGAPDAPELIARSGNQAPGMPAGTMYDSLGLADLNDAGEISFLAGFKLGNGINLSDDTAIYLGRPEAHLPVVREGDQAPGVLAGVHYASFDWPEINQTGQIIYAAGLSGAGITSANDRGLFAYDPSIGDVLIVQEGMAFDVGGGDLRIVESITDFSLIDAVGADANSPWSVAFSLRFNDSTSGLFLATVPEPAGMVMTSAFMMIIGMRRRKRN